MRILNAEETRASLSMRDAIEAMRSAFGPDRDLPQRQLVGASFFMPARVGRWSGVKVVSTVPGNPIGIVTVFDAEGTPVGSVDGQTLTAIRTGAGAGLATELLAPPDASILAMLGAGAMAFDQIEAVRAVRDAEVRIWSRTRANAIALAERVGGSVCDTPDETVSGAHIISTATPAATPLFHSAVVYPSAHINAVGAFTPKMAEVPASTVRSAFVVVDDRTAAAAEAGDLLQAGVEPDAELGDLLNATDRPADLTMFKSVGIASQDVAAAATALTNAEQLGIGTVV